LSPRSLEEQIKLRTFTKSDAHTARFLMAAIGGGVVGMFNNFNISQNVVTPLALAFLVGYATDVFFSFLEGLLQTFTRRADSQTPSPHKGVTIRLTIRSVPLRAAREYAVRSFGRTMVDFSFKKLIETDELESSFQSPQCFGTMLLRSLPNG
jgi:hypothetical protein